jgi:hypothetical protein
MDPSDHVTQDTILHRRYGTTGGVEKMEMHNRSEEGRLTRLRHSSNLICFSSSIP